METDVSKPKTFLSGTLALMAWGAIGASIGLVGGYFVYVKKPPRFESTVVLAVTRAEPDAETAAAELPAADWITSSESPDAATASGSPTGATRQIDDSAVILSEPVVARAIASNQLTRLPELGPLRQSAERSKVSLANALLRSGRLAVQRQGEGVTGTRYELRCQGDTPSSAQQLSQAMASSYSESLQRGGSQTADWQTAMDLIQQASGSVTQRLTALEQQLRQLDVPVGASLQAGRVVSPAAERLHQLRQESEQLVDQRVGLEQKLRRVESLIAQGAEADMILAALGKPVVVPARPTAPLVAQANSGDDAPDPAAVYQQQLAERARVAAEIERELKPLQTEYDRLLTQFAREHPRVRSVRTKMAAVQSKLDALPPLEPPANMSPRPAAKSPSEDSPAASAAANPGKSASSKGEQVSELLRALRIEAQRAGEAVESRRGALEDLAATVAFQQQRLTEEARIRDEIAAQQRLVESITARLQPLSRSSPFPEATAAILQAPTLGRQSAPELLPHLAVGGVAGGISGIVLAGLLLLTSVAVPAAGKGEG